MKNKFEHLMQEHHKEELEKEGRVRITQKSMTPPFNREEHIATVSHYVRVRIPYYVWKKISDDWGYRDKRDIKPVSNSYDSETKTIEITGLKPFLRCKALRESPRVDIIEEYYTYGV